MLDPPQDVGQHDQLLRARLPSGVCHLKRICRTTQEADSKCEYILLSDTVQFGRANSSNHVVLSCPDNLNIQNLHAVIRFVPDQVNGNVRHYEILAHQKASIYVNCCQIETEKFRRLSVGDCIVFGDKLADTDSFTFRFELADNILDYPITCANSSKSLTIFHNSLAYQVNSSKATLDEASLAEPAPHFDYEKALQPEFILKILEARRQQLSYSTKENLLLDYCPSIPVISSKIATSVIHDFIEVENGQTVHASPLIQQAVYKNDLPTKFDVDLIEVAKRIANRIIKRDSCDDQSVDDFDQHNNNIEKSHLQMPLIASVTNLNVYPCSTSLTPSSSISPPPYSTMDYSHASETSTSSTSFNHSDSGNFSANEGGHNSFNSSNVSNLSLSSVCTKKDEEMDLMNEETTEEENVKKSGETGKNLDQTSLTKSSSAARLEMLAALASSSNSQSFDDELDEKPLEIFIPLASCSDHDDSLSPTQTVKSEKILSPTTSSTPHRLGKIRSSRQSTHDADDFHHSSKQLKTQAGLEVCRRRMLKFIANNFYTTQIARQFKSDTQSILEKSQDEEKSLIEQPASMEVTKTEKPNADNEAPKPLNLYPNGDEYVTKKQRRNSKKLNTLAETITDEEQNLFATLLLSIRSQKAPLTTESNHSFSSNSLHESSINEDLNEKSEPVDKKIEKAVEEKTDEVVKEKKPTEPSCEEEQLLLKAERELPKLNGVGRHTVSKLRFLYRAELDRTSAATIPTQRYKLIEKCREDRQKFEKQLQVQQKKQQAAGRRRWQKRSSEQLPSPNMRNTLGSPIARMPIITKKSSTSSKQNACNQKRQSTDFSMLSTNDSTFDGFLSDEYGGKRTDQFYSADETEDPLKKNATPKSVVPFFAVQNARSAAINANVSIHNQQHRRSRKRQQSGQPNSENKPKGRRNSSTPKTKRGRFNGKGGRKPRKSAAEKEEDPCASADCSPKTVQLASASGGIIEWIACDSCSMWYHCLCVLGVNRPVGDNENFKCRQCEQS
ncbi:hypothetical protein M3Y97_00481000 [Aphelenchoides bicaudatus]|nr:hypothetical protein M3Y97_00481000 [Aphelenchoides bicaudatus]